MRQLLSCFSASVFPMVKEAFLRALSRRHQWSCPVAQIICGWETVRATANFCCTVCFPMFSTSVLNFNAKPSMPPCWRQACCTMHYSRANFSQLPREKSTSRGRNQTWAPPRIVKPASTQWCRSSTVKAVWILAGARCGYSTVATLTYDVWKPSGKWIASSLHSVKAQTLLKPTLQNRSCIDLVFASKPSCVRMAESLPVYHGHAVEVQSLRCKWGRGRDENLSFQ